MGTTCLLKFGDKILDKNDIVFIRKDVDFQQTIFYRSKKLKISQINLNPK